MTTLRFTNPATKGVFEWDPVYLRRASRLVLGGDPTYAHPLVRQVLEGGLVVTEADLAALVEIGLLSPEEATQVGKGETAPWMIWSRARSMRLEAELTAARVVNHQKRSAGQ